ncbi:MAG: helix-turn-helix domain-containing protein [Acidobacteria bacterium]|nr:helix-turn-helix domain-containing protein [Acidobacteriota bacterium]
MDTSSRSTVSGTPSVPAIETPLTAQELSKIVPLHHVTILKWAREGRIPSRRLSARKVLFLPSEVSKWLSSDSNLYPTNAVHAA